MIGLAIAGLAAIAGLVWLLVWLFSGSSYDKEMMAYMPENTQILVGVDVDHLMSLDGVKELLDNNNFAGAMGAGFGGGAEIEAFQKTGVKLKDIKRIMVGMPDPTKGNGTVAVIRFRDSVDKGKINSAVNAAEQKAGDKVYYRSSIKGACLHYGDDDLLVIAENEETMKKVLSKESGKIVINETLKELADKVGGGHVWAATSTNPLGGGGGGGFGALGLLGGGGRSGNNDADEFLNVIKNAKGFAFSMKIDNKSVRATGYAKCADSSSASRGADAAKRAIREAKKEMEKMSSKAGMGMGMATGQIREIFDSIDVDSSGDMLEGSIKVNSSPFRGGLGRTGPWF
jgi:hypothetical protein